MFTYPIKTCRPIPDDSSLYPLEKSRSQTPRSRGDCRMLSLAGKSSSVGTRWWSQAVNWLSEVESPRIETSGRAGVTSSVFWSRKLFNSTSSRSRYGMFNSWIDFTNSSSGILHNTHCFMSTAYTALAEVSWMRWFGNSVRRSWMFE